MLIKIFRGLNSNCFFKAKEAKYSKKKHAVPHIIMSTIIRIYNKNVK